MEYQLTEPTKNWQKVCHGEDFLHQDMKYVIEEILENNLSFHRKQWEFAVIFLALLQHKKLHADSVGASFGAGKEPIIYPITKMVSRFTATDLYSYKTGWSTAKIEKESDCRQFVLSNAPDNFPDEKLNVLEMDMRKLSFHDSSLDFCYSSCAFEHIGHHEDFVNHLKEVKRVLKNDGVYVMTTEHLYFHDTIKTKGNYKFNIKDLIEIFKDADFFPQPVFDNSLSQNSLNRPKPELTVLKGYTKKVDNLWPGITLCKLGIPYTSSCFIFKKSSNTKQIKLTDDFVRTKDYLKKGIDKNIKSIFAQYNSINPFAKLTKHSQSIMSDHSEYIVDDPDNYFKSINIEKGHFAYSDFIYLSDYNFKVVVVIHVNEKENLICKLIEVDQQMPFKRQVVSTEKILVHNKAKLSFNYTANPKKTYAVALKRSKPGQLNLGHLSIQLKII